MTNTQVMGDSFIGMEAAFAVYDEFLADPRITFRAEPDNLEPLMRTFAKPFARLAATKALGDLYLISFAIAARALGTRRSPVVLLP